MLESGFNDEAKRMSLICNPVILVHRPLVWYLVSLSPRKIDYAFKRQHLMYCTTFVTYVSQIIGGFDFYPPMSSADGFIHYTTPRWSHLALTLSDQSTQLILTYHTGTVPPLDDETCMASAYICSTTTTTLHYISPPSHVFLTYIKTTPTDQPMAVPDVAAQGPDVSSLIIELLQPHGSASNLAISRILTSLYILCFTLIANSYGSCTGPGAIHLYLIGAFRPSYPLPPAPIRRGV